MQNSMKETHQLNFYLSILVALLLIVINSIKIKKHLRSDSMAETHLKVTLVF